LGTGARASATSCCTDFPCRKSLWMTHSILPGSTGTAVLLCL
jgi:hypothetical protein